VVLQIPQIGAALLTELLESFEIIFD